MAILWYDRAPNMVVFFCGMVVTTQLLEAALMRHNRVYRDHLSFAQRRKCISHMWGAVIDIIGFILLCVAYVPAIFTGAAVGLHRTHILAALACIVMVGFMFDLAYVVPSVDLLCHHLFSVLGLVVMVFVVDATHEIQTFLMFSSILLLFETLSAPLHLAMVLHRLWASPVPHPVRYIWAGRFMLFSAWWSIFSKVGVYVFVAVRYIQVVRLGPGVGVAVGNERPVSQLHGTAWYWVVVLLIPVILVGLCYSHFYSWVVFFKLGMRHRRSLPSNALAVHNVDLQTVVVDEEKVRPRDS